MIRKANTADLNAILKWLRAEYRRENTGRGFWCNRNIIREAQQRGELDVLLVDDSPVAFCVYGPANGNLSILEVDPKRRRHGYGTILFRHVAKQIESTGALGIWGQCEPHSAMPFWSAMGFLSNEQFKRNELYIYKAFPSDPIEMPTAIELVIRIDDGRDYCVRAFEQDGSLQLCERFAHYVPSGDPILSVFSEKTLIHKDKIKYSSEIGVNYMWPFFAIDRVDPSEGHLPKNVA